MSKETERERERERESVCVCALVWLGALVLAPFMLSNFTVSVRGLALVHFGTNSICVGLEISDFGRRAAYRYAGHTGKRGFCAVCRLCIKHPISDIRLAGLLNQHS